MKTNIMIAAIFLSASFTSYAMSDKDICELRAGSMQEIAMARDLGKTKKQVKEIARRKLGRNLPDSFDIYLDIVYKEKEIKPSDIKVLFLYSCYKELGLIK